MNNEKKIAMQNKIIAELNDENTALKKRIVDLENDAKVNQELVEAAKHYAEDYNQCIKELNTVKNKYDELCRDLIKERAKFESEFKKFLNALS